MCVFCFRLLLRRELFILKGHYRLKGKIVLSVAANNGG